MKKFHRDVGDFKTKSIYLWQTNAANVREDNTMDIQQEITSDRPPPTTNPIPPLVERREAGLHYVSPNHSTPERNEPNHPRGKTEKWRPT